MDSLSPSPVRGGIIPNQTRRNRFTPGGEGRIQRGMSPQSGLGEKIQNTPNFARLSPCSRGCVATMNHARIAVGIPARRAPYNNPMRERLCRNSGIWGETADPKK